VENTSSIQRRIRRSEFRVRLAGAHGYADCKDDVQCSCSALKSIAEVSEDLPLTCLRFRIPKDGKEADWLYYPPSGAKPRGDSILLASPDTVDGHQRIVVMADGSGQFMEEAEFHRRLTAHITPGK